MRYIEWLILFVIAACGTGLANFIGYGAGFGTSLPGLTVLIVIFIKISHTPYEKNSFHKAINMEKTAIPFCFQRKLPHREIPVLLPSPAKGISYRIASCIQYRQEFL